MGGFRGGFGRVLEGFFGGVFWVVVLRFMFGLGMDYIWLNGVALILCAVGKEAHGYYHI